MSFKKLFGNIPDDPIVNEALSDALPDRITGKIIHLEEESGWGFIVSPEIKFERIFFHWTGLLQDTLRFYELTKGMEVEFTPIEYHDKGYRAIKIKVISSKEDTNDSNVETTTD